MHETIVSLNKVDDWLQDVQTGLEEKGSPRVYFAKLYMARAGIAYIQARLHLVQIEEEEPCEKS